ncbi:MAG: hypothetical protein P0S96_00925 [Simkaniaceae bacterium]|nr:hypothetical protein [Candidatus Sacchlamyda saccharinae]
MRWLLILTLCFSARSFPSFFEEGDPMHVYHVNVITGHLDLNFLDGNLNSPVPFTLSRSYSSAGALERSPDDVDLALKRLAHTNWKLQGGWDFLSHTALLVQFNSNTSKIKAFVQERGSTSLTQYTERKGTKKYFYLKPEIKNNKASGNINSRKNKEKNILKISHHQAILKLPDGTRYFYSGDLNHEESFWRLDLEVLPSKHRIVYEYSDASRWSSDIKRILIQNPSGSKTFATVDFDDSSYDDKQTLQLKTSDGKSFSYHMDDSFKERTYLRNAKTSVRPKETIHYQAGRKGIGARIGGMSIANQEQFRVDYYQPTDSKKEKKWAKKRKTHGKLDKVKSIQFPDPETEKFSTVAQFSYYPGSTEVEDIEGNLTRYLHDEGKLISIEYFDTQRCLHSKVEFNWRGSELVSKKLIDSNNNPLFCKIFSYDKAGNVTKESWRDYCSDIPVIARSIHYSKNRLPHTEEAANGVSYSYTYLPHTDLITQKITSYRGKIFLREFSVYDEDHLLISKTTDDGSAWDHDNLQSVTERHIQTFQRDEKTGLCTQVTESYLNLDTNRLEEIRTVHYQHNEKNEVISEIVECGGQRYTTRYEYDTCGRLARQTSPMGRVNTYEYDKLGNLISTKEAKNPQKNYQYDFSNRVKECTENGKTSENEHNIKGRLLKQTDPFQNTITQEYDCFGNSIKTSFPTAIDTEGKPYTPIVQCEYDSQGNLCVCTNPQGEKTKTTYNCLRKPTHIEYPDGSSTGHSYDESGNIIKTIHPDKTQTHFEYDPLQRTTSKILLSPEGEQLSKETWEYNAFHLLSYTNPMGLTTHYTYDQQGRKISQRAKNRVTTFTYDALGHLERVTKDGHSIIQKHNCEGEITETWDEDGHGNIENHTYFTYDSEGRKIKAKRITSQGIAKDYFAYNPENRLISHKDPLGNVTEFIYSETLNCLEQIVEQKTIVDPLGNQTTETYDASGKIASIEKKNKAQQITAKEEYYYDRAGNKTKRITHIYDKNHPIRTHTTRWKYNSRGMPIEEIEEGKKCTTNSYDAKGRLTKKTLPSGVVLRHKYDGLDRLISLKSSDRTVDFSYTYDQGPLPVLAKDNIQNRSWERTYNIFGELTSEIAPNGMTIHWEYDNQGRCTKYTLPDRSTIEYNYDALHMKTVSRYSARDNLKYTHTYTQFDPNGHVASEELIQQLGTQTTRHDLLERTETQANPWNAASTTYGPTGLTTQTSHTLFGAKEYTYDSLSQIKQEGATTHTFDSLGNPLTAQINDLNQIVSSESASFSYDKNGNPKLKSSQNSATLYEFDALGRLTLIHTPDERRVEYTYDPFQRLYSKTTYQKEHSYFHELNTWTRDHHFYLHDKEHEIGTLDDTQKIQQLKVLGLGILGDIGGAIALELNSEIFAPLHDFTGNIIALISTDGTLTEKSEIDAFGKDLLTTPSQNPWRFHSKRTEENLVYFGDRFYDPSLGRFFSPDPASSLESPNLYLYVRNSPLNRLDLFGLFSEEFETEVKINFIFEDTSYIHFQANYHDIQCDCLLVGDHLQKIQFTPEELHNDQVNILGHFNEFFSNDGIGVGITVYRNGINTSWEDFVTSCMSVADKIPGDGLKLFMYTPTEGIAKDVDNTMRERRKIETPEVSIHRQAVLAFSRELAKVSPKLLLLQVNHSRAGAVAHAAHEGMSEKEQETVSQNTLSIGVAPAMPLAKRFTKDSINFYSNEDHITGRFGIKEDRNQAHLPQDEKIYNIEFIPCISKWHEKTAYIADHGIMGTTYQTRLEDHLEQFEYKHGFYKENR